MTVRQINIGGNLIGLVELDDALERTRQLAIVDDEALKKTLLEKIKKKNWVAPGLEDTYREALLDEYRVFTGQAKASSAKGRPPEIRVYGAGCSRCENLDKLVVDA